MSLLIPGVPTDATTLGIPLEDVPDDQVVEGSPQTGSVDLTADGRIGVWETLRKVYVAG